MARVEAGTHEGRTSARRVRSVFAVVVFPLLMGGSLAYAAWELGRGASLDRAFGVPTIGAALLILVLERLVPYRSEWLRSHGDVRVDLLHAVSAGATAGLVRAGVLIAGVPVAAWLAARAGADLWPGGWSVWAQLPLALVVAELPKYWLHRGMHEWDGLWRFHATHHSVPRLYWLNAARFHPVDIALDTAVGLLPLALLGCGPTVLGLFLLVSAVHGYFQHANLPLRLGPLNYFFSMAELHRWHHSRAQSEANHNYGQNVIVWDLVFGSFLWPVDREPPEETGLADPPGFPVGWWGQLVSPFRWRALRRGVVPGGSAARA